jgi:hypothetical protein
MPGSYAHITLVNLASEKRVLTRINGFPPAAIYAVNMHSKFAVLGCISPDYPYLDLGSLDSKKWADVMHYTHTCNVIYEGAELVRRLPEGLAKEKCLAWLMGYAAHVFTDMFIHPVVELKVGPYKGNETAHRRCEMHQDAYIFQRMRLGMPQLSEYIKATILKCCASNNPKLLDPDVKKLWETLLNKIHPVVFAADPPAMNTWHQRCYNILQKILPSSSRLVGFARHAFDGLGLSYPTAAEIDKSYIENLKVPSPVGQEKRMHYDQIFDSAIECVSQAWRDVSIQALSGGNIIAYRNDEWDLDTGRNKNDEKQGPVFWRVV